MQALAKSWRQLLLLAGFTLLIHLPFISRPVQGDEVNYIDIARHIFQQPLTPLNFTYVFDGREMDMSGHSHPPLNAYALAFFWLLRGHFSPAFMHGCYLLFALAISLGTYALAARLTSRPLWAALLVASAPVVQVAANTVESDAPALAFLLIGAALFLARRFALAAVALTLAGFTALQAVVIGPILLFDYAIRRERPPRAALAAVIAPFAAWAGWQALQFALTHRLPVAVLGGYLTSTAHWGRLSMKVGNVLALVQHLGVLVVFLPLIRPKLIVLVPGVLAAALVPGYPWWERILLLVFVSLGVHALLWLWKRRSTDPFLAGWCLAYFAFALLVFFAGSARYLLPLAAPLVFLFVRQFSAKPKWLALALGINIVLGLNLSFADYDFARAHAGLPPPPGRSFLVNGEWGFRYRMVDSGGRMLHRNSVAAPGEWIVTSELSGANYDSQAEEIAVPLRTTEIHMTTPLRLVDRYAHSGYSSAVFGWLPFSFSLRPLDRITYACTSPFLNVKAAWLPTQFSGRLVYLPAPGAVVRLSVEPGWTKLRFALFARGSGSAGFTIADGNGRVLFKHSAPVNDELWQVENLPLEGVREALLSIEAAPGVQTGWGELVAY